MKIRIFSDDIQTLNDIDGLSIFGIMVKELNWEGAKPAREIQCTGIVYGLTYQKDAIHFQIRYKRENHSITFNNEKTSFYTVPEGGK